MIMQAIWAYVKSNDLQDPKDRRQFLKDPKLETIFKYPVNMFSLNTRVYPFMLSGYFRDGIIPEFPECSCLAELSRHVKPSGEVLQADSDVEDQPKPKKSKKSQAEKNKVAQSDTKPKKATGFTKPLKLSPELSAVVGTTQASRGECNKLLFAYIKEHGLQNPQNKSQILVYKDELLHKVLQVKECTQFGMSKYLKDHFLGPCD